MQDTKKRKKKASKSKKQAKEESEEESGEESDDESGSDKVRTFLSGVLVSVSPALRPDLETLQREDILVWRARGTSRL
jgi:hypothetical protein